MTYHKRLEMFNAFLDSNDARRAADLVGRLSEYGFRVGALTGGVALEARLVANGHTPQRRLLNDLDFVVEGFASIPSTLADRFLVHHIHADAPPGKIPLQLIDRDRALRIDLFRTLGATLSRADIPHGFAGPHKVISNRGSCGKNYVARLLSAAKESSDRSETCAVFHAAGLLRHLERD